MKKLAVVFILLFGLALVSTPALATQIFSLADLPTDPDQARQRLSQYKNAGHLELVPRDPAYLVLVSPKFWKSLSPRTRGEVIRDILYFCRFYNQNYGSHYGGTILLSRQNPAKELGWGNLIPGKIIIFK